MSLRAATELSAWLTKNQLEHQPTWNHRWTISVDHWHNSPDRYDQYQKYLLSNRDHNLWGCVHSSYLGITRETMSFDNVCHSSIDRMFAFRRRTDWVCRWKRHLHRGFEEQHGTWWEPYQGILHRRRRWNARVHSLAVLEWDRRWSDLHSDIDQREDLCISLCDFATFHWRIASANELRKSGTIFEAACM